MEDRKKKSRKNLVIVWMASLFAMGIIPCNAATLSEMEDNSIASFTPPFLYRSEKNKTPCVETPPIETPPPCQPLQPDSCFQIGGNYAYVTLKPSGNPSFHGNLGGAQALYEYKPMNYFYGGAKVTWRQGDTHGSAGKRSLVYIDVQERLGYTFGSSDKARQLTLFTGFAYRYLGHEFNPNTGSTLHFRYNEFYVPVGLLGSYDVSSWFSIGFGFIWEPQVFPTVTIVPLKGARWIIIYQLENFYAELPLTFALSKSRKYLLIVKPFYERWKDGHTTAKLAGGAPLGVPGNTYNFYGVELNLGFCF